MKAFSTMFKNINISIFKESVTIFNPLSGIDEEWRIKIQNVVVENFYKVGSVGTISHTHPDHMLVHQNSTFDKNHDHMHIIFDRIIDKKCLEGIKNGLIEFKILSETEGEQFVKAYNEANSFEQDLSRTVTNKSIKEVTKFNDLDEPSKEVLENIAKTPFFFIDEELSRGIKLFDKIASTPFTLIEDQDEVQIETKLNI